MAERRRDGLYIWVTWLTRLLVGENSCEWAVWFRAQHEGWSWTKVLNGFDQVSWQLAHTIHVSELIKNLSGLVQLLGAGEPARRIPSPRECGFCDISLLDCPERVAEDAVAEGVTEDFCLGQAPCVRFWLVAFQGVGSSRLQEL